jgi:hypothetical protein
MRQTLAQKLLARAARRASVTPGEIVTCKVDLAMMHDSGGPRRVKPLLERLGAKVWDPSKVVVITDHYLPEYDDESRKILRIARDWVREAGIDNFYDAQGICHVVLPERGHLKPGMFAVGGDSLAKSGFGGTEYLLPALVSEGAKRGLSYNRIAELTSRNPAQRFGLNAKGDIAEGLDADLVLVDPKESWTIRAADSASAQGYTPFEGIELGARVKATFLRGALVCEDGKVVGQPRGKYLHRPTA